MRDTQGKHKKTKQIRTKFLGLHIRPRIRNIKRMQSIYGTNQRGWGRFQRDVIFFQTLGPQCDKKYFNMYAKVVSPVQ